jgi:hypothetical protein
MDRAAAAVLRWGMHQALPSRVHWPACFGAAFLAGAVALLLSHTAVRAQDVKTTRQAIPDAVWQRMQGSSWHADLDCPARETLVLLTITYRDFEGRLQTGDMIVHADVASDVMAIFDGILQTGFRIHSIRLVDDFGGDDNRSMLANNTSGFNCRMVPFGANLSAHATGRAIDINPVQNPYVRGKRTLPPSGEIYDQPAERRNAGVVGLITDESPVVRIFRRHGWIWGGNWRNSKDYQHFSSTGR